MGNFTKTEKTIFTLALLVLVIFTYFLYDDSLIFPRESTSNLQPIGDISASSNDVRRKNIESFSWMPASKTDQVFEMIPFSLVTTPKRKLLYKTVQF